VLGSKETSAHDEFSQVKVQGPSVLDGASPAHIVTSRLA